MSAPAHGTESLSFLVRHAWLSMRGVIAGALAEHGLTPAQYGTLICLDEQPGLSVADLARKVASTRQSATELLAGLERAGLVERRRHPRDRRTQQLFLTAAGSARLAEAGPAVRAVEGTLEAAFTEEERAVARAWLARMATVGEGAPEEIPTS